MRVQTPDGKVVEFPDGTSEQEIAAALGGGSSPASIPPSAVQAATINRVPRMVADALPSGLGGLGGLPGGWAGVVLGAAGGAVGQAGRGAMMGKFDPGAILASGAEQGAYGLIPLGMGGVSRRLMTQALKPTLKSADEFGRVANTVLKERLMPTARGLAKGVELRGRSAQTTRGLLRGSGAMGNRYRAADLIDGVNGLIVAAGKKPQGGDEEAALVAMTAEFLKRFRGRLTPMNLKKLKQESWKEAKPILDALARPETAGSVPASASYRARWHQALANDVQKILERDVPGMAESEKRTQSLIGATRALKQVQRRKMVGKDTGVSLLAGVPFGVGNLVVPPGLRPYVPHIPTSVAGFTALQLYDPIIQQLMANLPRTAGYLAQTAPADVIAPPEDLNK